MGEKEQVEMTHAIELLPPKIIGWGTRDGEPYPIHSIAGGDGEVLAGDDDDPDSDADHDDDPNDDDTRWRPPTKAEWEALQATKARAESEAIQRRQYLRDAGINHRTGKPIVPPRADEPEVELEDDGAVKPPPAVDEAAAKRAEKAAEKAAERAMDRARAEVEAKYRPALALTAVKGALESAGWAGKDHTLALRLIDLDEIDVDPDTHEVVGAAEQVAAVKEQFPGLFRRPAARRAPGEGSGGAGDVDGADRLPNSRVREPEPKGWLARVDKQLRTAGR